MTEILDPDSYESWDGPLAAPSSAAVLRAQERTGRDESVQTGRARINGHGVAVITVDFAFIGGTIGVVAAHRMIGAIRRATDERAPLLIVTSSGGTRVTEGTHAFVTMTAVAAAIRNHTSQALPYIAYLRHPTLGGAYASWGSLAHLTIAEPSARIGFLGPKVHRAITGTPMPDGAQSAEALHARRTVDHLATPDRARGLVADFLDVLTTSPRTEHTAGAMGVPALDPDPLTIVLNSRDVRRPNAREVLGLGWPTHFRFHPTRSPIETALVATGRGPAVVIAQQRDAGELTAQDFRHARRAISLAGSLRLPILAVIDTPGAESSAAAEADDIAREIAHTLGALLGHEHPVVSVLLGQGTGGGAIALLPADHTIAAENSWLAPLPPEGFSAIMHGSEEERLMNFAATPGLTPTALQGLGIVDEIIPEGDLTSDAGPFAKRLATAVDRALRALSTTGADPASARAHRYFSISEHLSRKGFDS